MRCAPMCCALALVPCALLTPGRADAAAVLYFTDSASFETQMLLSTKTRKGVEDFEYANIQGQGKFPFPDHLTGGVANGPFPAGLLSPNLTIQTNRNPGPLAPVDVPSIDPNALFAVSAGAFGANSKKVGEDLGILRNLHCSLDLIFDSDDKTGVGFELSRFTGYGNSGWTLGIFDTSDVLIGQYTIAGPVVTNPGKVFFGVWASTPIGRINIYDPDPSSPDAVDDIQMWTIPAPATTPLLVLAGLLAARRKR